MAHKAGMTPTRMDQIEVRGASISQVQIPFQ
jgi:hypothetical protein